MTDKPKRWVEAPRAAHPGASAVLGVHLGDDEDVRWVWTHTPRGSYVSGYSIEKKGPDKGHVQTIAGTGHGQR